MKGWFCAFVLRRFELILWRLRPGIGRTVTFLGGVRGASGPGVDIGPTRVVESGWKTFGGETVFVQIVFAFARPSIVN